MWWYTSVAIMVILSVCYLSLILYYRNKFLKLKEYPPARHTPTTKFSIIIPARNEEENIRVCLQSIYQNDYPPELFEVLVIDDHSTDSTSEVIKSFSLNYSSLKLITLADELDTKRLNAYKKKAIEIAIGKSSGDWIITTDADCIVPVKWLINLDNFIQDKKPVLIAGPVKFINTGSFVSIFQCLDFLGLQGITAASVSSGMHSMCNGANLAYAKEAFYAVNGFKGIDNVASGDDMLLMHKIGKNFPGRIEYIFSKENIVSTDPMPDWKSLINQRIRWASKSENYDDKSILWVLVIVYLYNVMLTVLPVLGLWNIFFLHAVIVLVLFKIIAELLLLFPVAAFYNEKKMLGWFPIMQPLHIVYSVTVGWLGKFGSYQWKGRKVI